MQSKTKRLTESAMLLAVAIVLELASKMFIPEMPFGGQVTLASMLPVVLISYRHGVKWGIVSGVAYAFIQMAIGARTVAAAFQPGYFGDGRMLLNVGPRPDGTITEAETRILKDLGAWMAVNGEGIREASPWKWFSEGSVNAQSGFFMDGDEKAFTAEDFRFTYRAGFIYAFQMRPDGRDVTIRTLAEKGMYDFILDRVELLGSEEKLIWKRDGEGLHIFLPEQVNTEFPLTFKIRMM